MVTTLKRQATKLIAQLQASKAPILITEHGQPAAYLVDVEGFEALTRRLALLETIARGEKAIEDGRLFSHEQAKRRLKRWLT